MTTPNPSSARRGLRAAGRGILQQRRGNATNAQKRCLQKEQQKHSCDLTKAGPVLNGSIAPHPAAGRPYNHRRENDLTIVCPVLDGSTAPLAAVQWKKDLAMFVGSGVGDEAVEEPGEL